MNSFQGATLAYHLAAGTQPPPGGWLPGVDLFLRDGDLISCTRAGKETVLWSLPQQPDEGEYGGDVEGDDVLEDLNTCPTLGVLFRVALTPQEPAVYIDSNRHGVRISYLKAWPEEDESPAHFSVHTVDIPAPCADHGA